MKASASCHVHLPASIFVEDSFNSNFDLIFFFQSMFVDRGGGGFYNCKRASSSKRGFIHCVYMFGGEGEGERGGGLETY